MKARIVFIDKTSWEGNISEYRQGDGNIYMTDKKTKEIIEFDGDSVYELYLNGDLMWSLERYNELNKKKN